MVVYKLVLLSLYDNIIAVNYSYYGFSTSDSSPITLALYWGQYLIVIKLLSALISRERPSSVIAIILCCLSFVPTSIYFERSGLPLFYWVALFLYWVGFLSLLIKLPAINLSFRKGTDTKIGQKKLRLVGDFIVLIFAIYILALKYKFNGLYLHFDISDVYGLRLQAKAYSFGFMSVYLMNWASLVFAIRGVIALRRRQYYVLLFMLFMELLLFSIAGHKFHLFALPTALLISKMYRPGRLYHIPAGFSALCIASSVLWYSFGSTLLVFLIPFRQLFLPAWITGNFVDFFSTNTPDLLQQSIFGRLGFQSSYELPIPYLIDSYYGNGNASANTGLLGDAYANFGFYGVFIYPPMFAAALRMLDAGSKKIELKYNLGVVIFISIAFLNMAFFTALLTGGVLISLLFLKTQSTKSIGS